MPYSKSGCVRWCLGYFWLTLNRNSTSGYSLQRGGGSGSGYKHRYGEEYARQSKGNKMQMQMTDIDWRLPIAEKMEEKEAQKQLQTALHKKFESLVVASNVLKAVEKFKGLLHHVRFFRINLIIL